jgi:opacity protein-like surface antigen
MSSRLALSLALALWLAPIPSSHAAEAADASIEPAHESATPPAESPDYARLGPYVAVGGGAAVGDMGPASAGMPRPAPGLYEVLETGSLNVRAGWRFHRHLSAELLWEYQTAWEFEAGQSFESYPKDDHAEFHAWNLLANLKLHLTTSRCQPFLMTGIGLGRRSLETTAVAFDPNSNLLRTLSDHDEAFVARLGGGLDFYANDHVTLGAELAWVIGTGDLAGLDYGVATAVLAWHLPY